jgi:ABC-type nitrate/sulfonate/bicarbonate transport system permease component
VTIPSWVRLIVWELWLPVVLIALWWVVSANSTDIYFPALSAIFEAFRDNWLFERVESDLLPSLQRLGIGYALALVLGIAAGLVLGISRHAATAFGPVIEFLRAMPSVAVLPIMVLFFGLGDQMKVAILAFVGFFPIMMNTMDGARAVDSQLREVAASFRLRFRERVRYIFLPAAAPQIFAGARIGLSMSVMALALAELVGEPGGVGHAVLDAQRSFDIPAMWAGILMFGVLGYVLNRLFLVVERVVLAWHHGMTQRDNA